MLYPKKYELCGSLPYALAIRDTSQCLVSKIASTEVPSQFSKHSGHSRSGLCASSAVGALYTLPQPSGKGQIVGTPSGDLERESLVVVKRASALQGPFSLA